MQPLRYPASSSYHRAQHAGHVLRSVENDRRIYSQVLDRFSRLTSARPTALASESLMYGFMTGSPPRMISVPDASRHHACRRQQIRNRRLEHDSTSVDCDRISPRMALTMATILDAGLVGLSSSPPVGPDRYRARIPIVQQALH